MELSAQELCFTANDSSLTKKVEAALYRKTTDAKVAISIQNSGATCRSSDAWIHVEFAADWQSVNICVTPNDNDVAREGIVTLSYQGYSWPIKVTQAGKSAVSYSSWATANGVSGTWNAKDENGIYNVFRYVFGVPTGKFTETPLIDIAFVDGSPVIKTPVILNQSGFTLSVEASDNADGTGNATSFPLNASGETRIEGEVKPSRFFRLKAVLQ